MSSFATGVSGTGTTPGAIAIDISSIKGDYNAQYLAFRLTPTSAVGSESAQDFTNVATLTLTGDFRPLQISTQPQSQHGYWGKTVSFTVGVTNGTAPYAFQWEKDGVAILNATNSLMVLENLQSTNAGAYKVVVTDAASTTLPSQPANLTVDAAGVAIALYAGVTIDGVVGQTYGIQMTSDLSNTNSWVGVVNVTLTTPTQLWYDTQAATQPQRCYRVVPGPISIP